MKKIFWYMMALVLVGCAFTACNDDEDQVQPVLLEVVKSDVDFAAAGGVGTIQIKSVEATVTATADQPWVTINNANAKAVTFTVAESGDPLIRTATITIKAGTAVQAVSILQAPATMVLENTAIEVDPTGQTPTTITYDTSMESAPVVTIPAEAQAWLTVTAEAGKLTFQGNLNYTGARETVVKVEQGWKPVEITVSQDVVNLVTFDVPEECDRDAITVDVVPTEYMAMTSGNWDVQSPNEWITITKTDAGCTVEVAENNSGAVRTSTVNVLIDGEVLTTYTFKQKIYSYNFFLGQWTMNYNNGSTLKVTFAEKEPGVSYYMNGLTYNNVVLNYVDGDVPMLTMVVQFMEVDSKGNYVYLLMRKQGGGSYYWSAGYGANLVYNMSESAQALQFQCNGVSTGNGDPEMTGFSFNWFSGQPASSSTNLAKYNGRYLEVTTFSR